MTILDPFDEVERPIRDEDLVERENRPAKRPLIKLPDSNEVVAYTRITTLIKSIEETFHLNLYQQRLVAEGMIRRPDLQLEYAATMPLIAGVVKPDTDMKRTQNTLAWAAQLAATNDVGYVIQTLRKWLELQGVQNDIVEQARAAAGDNIRANVGTQLHALTERHDLGLPIGFVPEQWREDLRAYIKATATMRMVEVEGFVVVDEYQVAGTPDRIVHIPDQACLECFSEYFVLELKSGDVEFAPATIARQMALGAHGLRYHPTTKTRTQRPWYVCKHRGILCHLPAGQGVCELQWMEYLDRAWDSIQTCYDAHQLQKREQWTTPFILEPSDDPIVALIHDATSREELLGHRQHWGDLWDREHDRIARAHCDWLAQKKLA